MTVHGEEVSAEDDLTAADILARKQRPIVLDDVEVTEYNGVKLGSIEDFRDNSIKGPQDVDKESYRLVIDGLVNNQQSMTYDEVVDRQMYRKVVTLDCVEGWSVKVLWEGILVRDLLEQADPKFTANNVIFHAADGYTSSLPLEYLMENDILLAYAMNNVTLPPERGFPFQLVAEQKWGYKWVKWITRIELSNDPDYEGYWESRGWDNEADLDKPPR
ncbi:molybdopterin-dependent oxidoreductase [Candidatus Woesearchaeota archaeon]|nr:molybdopterin-dependent oxidoreductase [Candidatus Woesearchaeota archaeon]